MAEEIYSPDPLMIQESLEEWVMTKCENWRDHYESNYEEKFEEYWKNLRYLTEFLGTPKYTVDDLSYEELTVNKKAAAESSH